MRWNFLWCVAGGVGCLNLIRTSVVKAGNPILSSMHADFLIFSIGCFVAAWFVYDYENN